MPSVSRHAFAHVMGKVETLEDEVDAQQARLKTARSAAARKQDETILNHLLAQLHGARNELARLTDGHQHGHHSS